MSSVPWKNLQLVNENCLKQTVAGFQWKLPKTKKQNKTFLYEMLQVRNENDKEATRENCLFSMQKLLLLIFNENLEEATRE